MSIAARPAPHPHPPGPRNVPQQHRPARREWSEMPTLVGAQAVIDFARDELGVTLTRSIVRHATEGRRIKVFKVSARNVYSEAGVVRFIERLARPVVGEEASA